MGNACGKPPYEGRVSLPFRTAIREWELTPFTQKSRSTKLAWLEQCDWKTDVKDERERAGLSTSICEAALNQFGQSDDSLAGVIGEHDISVRDFMLLSLVCDQNCFDIDQLERALGLENDAVTRSVERLSAASLLCPDVDIPETSLDKRVCASEAGKKLARRILRTISDFDA